MRALRHLTGNLVTCFAKSHNALICAFVKLSPISCYSTRRVDRPVYIVPNLTAGPTAGDCSAHCSQSHTNRGANGRTASGLDESANYCTQLPPTRTACPTASEGSSPDSGFLCYHLPPRGFRSG